MSRVEVATFDKKEWLNTGSSSAYSDVALLELSKRLDLNTYSPACLAKTSDFDRFEGENSEALVLRGSFLVGSRLVNLKSPLVDFKSCLDWMIKLGHKEFFIFGKYDPAIVSNLVPGMLCSVVENNESTREGT